MYRSYDEFETSNYKTRSINNILKRITNDKVATRAMNSDTKQTDDYAIDVLNTNDPSCYGITKGDRATISRLCIIRLKERDIRKSEFKKYIDVIDNPNFAYYLYEYLMSIDISEFINNKSFNRYPIDRTQSIVKQVVYGRPVFNQTYPSSLRKLRSDALLHGASPLDPLSLALTS